MNVVDSSGWNATLWTQDVDLEGIQGVKYTARQ